MQQHASGQPPEKKLRVGGNYTTADPNNYDYQVKFFFPFIHHSSFSIPEKCQSNSTATTTHVSSTTSLLICLLFNLYMHIYIYILIIIYFLVH